MDKRSLCRVTAIASRNGAPQAHILKEKTPLVDLGHTFSVTRLYSSLRTTHVQWRAEA
ncbi:hypothetical protein BDP81DRAFT_439078 [Colletotrichum phormii]|uniref:Uncharacterized protein n=1 Tax=Colletotrichum phormii TaxID=359342 RepID=A0AAJ0EBE1_9PEZI|nr:uncharacterized protein BDP81DRAFT_439078 [Colletotrichum phormii]KAK1623567.1 hypothetical protein BDP81DRAFT_439078 [Colletotrichum phormii]